MAAIRALAEVAVRCFWAFGTFLSDFAAGAYVGDNLLQAQERVISQERLLDRTVDRPIQVPNERIVEEVGMHSLIPLPPRRTSSSNCHPLAAPGRHHIERLMHILSVQCILVLWWHFQSLERISNTGWRSRSKHPRG